MEHVEDMAYKRNGAASVRWFYPMSFQGSIYTWLQLSMIRSTFPHLPDPPDPSWVSGFSV